MSSVRVTLGKNGSIKVEAEGFVGSSCEEATRFIDELFGEPSDKGYKPEYYETDKDTVVEGLGNGWCG